MKNNSIKALLIFVAVFLLLGIGGRVLAQSMFPTSVNAASGKRIQLIHVEGMISAGPEELGFFPTGYASSVGIAGQIYRAMEDPNVVAVLLRINSPGGSAAASDEIYQAVLACREAGKPVVVSMGDVAASGGYYIASAADHVFANGATLTGSIGVVMQHINWGGLADEWGIEADSLHAGKYKDIGSPWRDMTGEERAMLEELLADVHEQFIVAVAAGRVNLSEDEVRELATGMIFTGAKAVENGLVDEIGGLEAAKIKVRALAGVGRDVPIEQESVAGFWESIFSMQAPTSGVATPPIDPALIQRLLSDDPLSLLSRSLYLSTTVRDLQLR